MRRIELSDVSSNLLVVSAIMVALLPMLLGDHLTLIVGDGMRNCGVLLDQCSSYLTYLVS